MVAKEMNALLYSEVRTPSLLLSLFVIPKADLLILPTLSISAIPPFLFLFYL